MSFSAMHCLQVRVVGVHLVEVEEKPYLALVQETAPGGDLGWQIEDCDFHTGRGGSASMVSSVGGLCVLCMCFCSARCRSFCLCHVHL
jgi:hypothetical protein